MNYEDVTFAQYIENLAKTDMASNGLEYDNTEDNNLRYVGEIPRMYLILT